MIILTLLLLLILQSGEAELQSQAGSRRIAWLHGSVTMGPHIQTGVVPIFDKRNTMEPITFTFTTPLPRMPPAPIPSLPLLSPPSPFHSPSVPSPPLLRPADQYEAPYARPSPPRMSAYKPTFQASFAQQPPPVFSGNYQIPSSISARSAYLPPSPSSRYLPPPPLPSPFSPSSPPSSPLTDLFGGEIDGTTVIPPPSIDYNSTTVTLPQATNSTIVTTSSTPRVFRITLPYPKKKGKKVVTTTPVSVLEVLREPRKITIRLPPPDERVSSGMNSTTVDEEPISIDPEIIKKTLWDAVDVLKGAVAEAGVDRDWRALWTKMSGVVEPYMEKMTEHLGSAINLALRQQNNRRMRTTSSPYAFYSSNQHRVKRS